ncbi:TonB family protein [Noviherbaspirillum sp. ST9]|uniref:TonB family protein n=1 Tax=Noviherbaspirillum sp. ST9 TaxID=3401606 RepID=UPI003B588B9A
MTSRTTARTAPADGPFRLRMTGALTVSLVVHAAIISLQFGAPGVGLPALELPWRERRAQAVDLQVALAPPSSAAEAASPAPPPNAASAPATGLRLVPLPPAPTPKARTKPGTAKPAASRPARPRIKRETPVIALNNARDSRFNMPPPATDEITPLPEPKAALPEPAASVSEEELASREREHAALRQAEEEKALHAREAEALAARQQQEEAEAARRQEEEARARVLAQEAQRVEEAKRREEAERAALALEEQRKAEEASRQAAALALQHQREEAARRAMELEEKQRAEAVRLQEERLRREAAELQARKQAEAAEAARARQAEELAARKKAEIEAASASRRERAPELALGDSPAPGSRIDALPRDVGGGLAGRALEQARRGDILRNDAPVRQPENAADQPRRRSFLGGKDVDVGVMMYVESWRLKIERNGSIMYPRAAVDKAQGDPVVTVAVRSDGSVENVVIHRSSGRSELDEAVHRIVRMNARYSAFPPELARRFDVIEIRKVWNFDDRLRILDEVR